MKELEELKFLKEVSGGLTDEELPEGLHERIMKKVRSEHRIKRLNWLRYSVIPVAAALTIFFISQGIPDVISSKSTGRENAAQTQDLVMATPGRGLINDPAGPEETQISSLEGSKENKDIEDRKDTAADNINDMKNEGTDETYNDASNDMLLGSAQGENDKVIGSGYDEKIRNNSSVRYIVYGLVVCLPVGLILIAKHRKRKSEA